MLVVLTAFVTFMITIFTMYSYFDKEKVSGKINLNENIGSITTINSDSNIDKYLNKIKTTINKYYLWKDKIEDDKLQDSAVKGYVAGLGDEYTEYIPADEMKEYKEEITGNFVGIGIYMIADQESNRVVVHYPIPGSPAEKAGIKAGDLIVNVDGKEYTAKDFDNIADYIKGEEGTNVNIEIERNGERLKFDIKREKINTHPITTKILNDNRGKSCFSGQNLQTKISNCKEFSVYDVKQIGTDILIKLIKKV